MSPLKAFEVLKGHKDKVNDIDFAKIHDDQELDIAALDKQMGRSWPGTACLIEEEQPC